MKGIRWGGLLTFVSITALVVVALMFFIEPLVKNLLQSKLTEINKAKVDVTEVDLTFIPLSLSVKGVHVTDSGNDMMNMMEIAELSFSLSLDDLLLEKVVINDMSISGVRLNTPRTVSGKIQFKEKIPDEIVSEDNSDKSFDLPKVDLPDVKAILSKEKLTAETLISDLNKDIRSTTKNWKNISEDIDDKKRWQQYDNDYELIKLKFEGDAAKKIEAVKLAKNLSESLKAEIKKIKQAKKTFNTDLDRLNHDFDIAKKSPSADIKRIKDKYSLNNSGAANVTRLLFGEQAGEWLELAQVWYARLEPYLGDDEDDEPEIEEPERISGIKVAFKENNPTPAFYIKKASIDALTERGEFQGEITDVSSDQKINNKAMKFKISGVNLKNQDAEVVSGTFNYTTKSKGYSHVNYVVQAYQLKDYKLSKSSSMPISIATSLMDITANIHFQNGVLTSKTNMAFNDSVFHAGNADSGGEVSKMIASSFKDINEFTVNANVKGKMDGLKFSIKSDLDKRIGQQFKLKLDEKKTSI